LPPRGSDAAAMIAPPIKSRHGSERRQRSRMVPVRFADGELMKLDRRADDTGLSRSAYLRMRALDDPGPRARQRVPVDMQALGRATIEINRAGNNLNQIARALNEIARRADSLPAGDELAKLVAELALPIRSLRADFAVPLAAMLAAAGRDRQG
jgi:Mobilization protein NikA